MAAPPKKKSVDEIWKELNSGSRVLPRSASTGIPGFGIPGVQTRTRVLPAQHTQQEHPAAGILGKQQHPVVDHAAALQKAAQQYDPAAAGVSQEAVQEYVAGLQRTINCLSDPDRSTRRNAAGSLATKLLKGDAATQKASPALLQALLSGPLLLPLANLLSDPVERCRLMALQLLLDAAPQLADPGPMLTGLLPVLVARMGRLPVEEPAEEVRLAAQVLIQTVVKQASCSTLSAATDDLCLLLARGLEDGFPDAKKAASAGLAALAAKLPQAALEGNAERLLQALLPNLSHQHSKVRLAAVCGLQALVQSGLPAGLLDSQVAPAVKPLVFDHTTSVREAFYSALASWLGCSQQQQQQQGADGSEQAAAAATAAETAHAQCKTYAPVLLPLLLLGISDPHEAIAAATLAAIEQAGQAWVLQPALTAAAATGEAAAGGSSSSTEAVPMDVDAAADTSSALASSSNSNSSAGVVNADSLQATPAAIAAAQLQPPYHGLPSTPCRQMVAALLPQLLPVALRGLHEWTVSLRSAAARLLHSVLVFAGPTATPHLTHVIPELIRAMSDDDTGVVSLLAASCRVLGAFVPSTAWLPLLVDAVADPKSGPGSKANALVVLSCLTHAAAAAQQPADAQLLQALVRVLASEELLGCEHVGVQTQLLIVVDNLLSWMPAAAVVEVRQQFYLVLLQLHGAASAAAAATGANAATAAASAGTGTAPAAGAPRGSSSSGSSAQASRALAVMQRLAQVTGLTGGVTQLAAAHAQQLLPALAADVGKWGSGSSNLVSFTSLLQTAGPECLSGLLPQVAQVLQPILSDPDKEPALRLSLLQLLDSLLEGPSTAAVFVGCTSNAQLTLQALLLPPLVWRAGKATAAVRFAAATALATFLSSPAGPPPAEVLLQAVAASVPSAQQQQQQGSKQRGSGGLLLLPLLSQLLDEDWYADVRHTACFVTQRLLEQVGADMSDEARRMVYPELLKRLDDSSNKVRIAACAALVAFVRSAGSSYCATNSGYLAAGVVLHMDDSDTQVAEAACQVLEALAATQPAVAAAEVHKVKERFRAQHYCDRVLAACAAAQS